MLACLIFFPFWYTAIVFRPVKSTPKSTQILELITFEILAAERLRLMGFDKKKHCSGSIAGTLIQKLRFARVNE